MGTCVLWVLWAVSETSAAVRCEIAPTSPAPIQQAVVLRVGSASGSGALEFSWDFADGTPPTPYSSATSVSHAFAAPGHYAVVLTTRDETGAIGGATATQMVHFTLPASRPAASSTILVDAPANRVWCVNPDADTVAALDATSLAKVVEIPVGRHPRTLARAPDGTIWVANQDAASISVVSGAGVVATIPLPRASRPAGIVFSPDGAAAYVSLEGVGRVARLAPAGRSLVALLDVGPSPRGLAVSADSTRLLVTRFVSPRDRGEVVEVATGPFAVARTFALAADPGPDTERGARGVPNYLTSITISPDGRRAWVPSKKDNTFRGGARDGLPLTFESGVRTIVSQIDLLANVEGTRIDLNDRDSATALQFSRHGDLAFVAVQGNHAIEVIDAYAEERTLATIPDVGLAPQGLAFDPAGERLFVQNFLGRSVSVYDVSGVVRFTTNTVVKLATVATVAAEPLSPAELRGKRLFYDAGDRRMNRDGYLSCASCHLDGADDGRVWDFTDRGEGLRNTTDLRGRRGTGHGPVHWTANFDEIQDFEHDIRGAFKGAGFLADADFHSGTRDTPLGDPKAGLSPELDALAAYLASLRDVPPSPHRSPDASLTPSGRAGRAVFDRLACAGCHAGPDFTDSARRVLHDVGTLTAASGRRLGAPLSGLDTPTLKGLWATAPYLHDGSAATLDDVLAAAAVSGRHGDVASLSPAERRDLIAYLLQLDESDARVVRQGADGTVAIEATRYSARHDAGGQAWTADGSSMRSGPNTGAQIETTAGPRLDYHVLFTRGGPHRVWVRGAGATTADNSVHVGIDWSVGPGADRIGPFASSAGWVSATMDGPDATVDVPGPGVHTISVWMREDGFAFDKLVVASDLSLAVSGDGPPPSPAVELPDADAAVDAGGGSPGGCGALGAEVALLFLFALLKRRRSPR